MKLSLYSFAFETHMLTKIDKREKTKKLCFIGQIVIESHSPLEQGTNR